MEQRQIAKLEAKGYRIFLASKRDMTQDVASERVKVFFEEEFEIISVVPTGNTVVVPIQPSKPYSKSEKVPSVLATWYTVEPALKEVFTAKDLYEKLLLCGIHIQPTSTYNYINEYIRHSKIEYIEGTGPRQYRKIHKEASSRLSQQALEDRKSIIDTAK